jgi:hypothetical protein
MNQEGDTLLSTSTGWKDQERHCRTYVVTLIQSGTCSCFAYQTGTAFNISFGKLVFKPEFIIPFQFTYSLPIEIWGSCVDV